MKGREYDLRLNDAFAREDEFDVFKSASISRDASKPSKSSKNSKAT